MPSQHPYDPPPPTAPQRRSARSSAAAAAALAAVAVGVALTAGHPGPLPAAAAEPGTDTPSTTSSSAGSTSPATSGTAGAGTTGAAPAGVEFATDTSGYVGSQARCDSDQELMVLGRTSRALVAICVDPDGELEYRGVRLSDEAALQMPAAKAADGSIVGSNDGVTYAVSPTMLLVSEGDTVIYRDSWTEFREPRFTDPATPTATSSTPTTSTPTTSTPTTGTAAPSTVTTTTVTVTPDSAG